MRTEPFYLGTLVRYLRDSGKLDASLYGGKAGSRFSYQGAMEYLGMSKRSQLTNLLDGDTNANYDRVRMLFEEPIRANFGYLPSHLQGMAREIYDLEVPADISDLLLQGTIQEPSKIAEFCDSYAGVYTVWRYSGHLERTDRPYKREDGSYGAWVVRAGLEIARGNSHPTFRIRYKPQNTQNERDISGLVLRIGDPGHIYFWGYEPTSGYPLMMVAKHNRGGASRHEAMVIRKHEADRVFTSKVILERDVSDHALNDMTVGMFREDEVAEEIADFRELMENESYQAPLVGTKCAIVL